MSRRLTWMICLVAVLVVAFAPLPLAVAPYLTLPLVLVAGYHYGLTAAAAAGLVGAVVIAFGPSADIGTGEAWLVIIASVAISLVAGGLFDATKRAKTRVLQAQMTTLRSFATAVEADDEAGSGEHCERVAQNARSLGAALGLPRRQQEELYWAGLLHDIGKFSIPREILQKPSGLTLEEYLVMRRHARLGANLLHSIEGLERVAEGIGSHHERWDGSGYPAGLHGDAIPLYGRILAVVDVFEALSSDRPYRRALPPDLALEELRRNAGRHFDPALVALYEQLYLDGKILVAGADSGTHERQPALPLRSLEHSWGETG